MIPANELRIGNWVQYAQGNVKCQIGALGQRNVGIVGNLAELKYIHECQTYLDSKQIFAIPLLPEILESCGFKSNDDYGYYYKEFEKDREIISFSLFVDDIAWLENKSNSNEIVISEKILHLHQLQNIYWCLVGEELKINLNVEAYD